MSKKARATQPKKLQHEARAHSPIGASSMHRWAECPGSIRLSRDLPPAPSSPYAEEGTRAHELAEGYLRTGTWDVDAPNDMLDAVKVYVDYVEGLAVSGELLIEQSFDLGDVHPGLFGTCDAVVIDREAKKLHVIDLKYGRGIGVDAKDNPQLLYYALGALFSTRGSFHPDTVELTIVQPRIEPAIRTHSISASELLDFVFDLKEAALATEEKDAPLTPGDHCRFCPAAGVCDAVKDKALAIAKTEFSAIEKDPSKLEAILPWLSTFENWIEDVRKFAYEEALRGNAPKGWKLVDKRATRKWKSECDATVFLQTNFPKVENFLESPKLKSPAQVEGVLHQKQHTKIAHLIEKVSSGTKLVPFDSAGEPIRVITAQEEFAAVDIFS